MSSASTQTPPSPNLTGLPGIDAMIAALTASISSQAGNARKALLQSQKGLKLQRAANKQELAFQKAQLAALNVQPAPQVKGLNSAEVMQAQRQTQLDAAGNNGLRASILTGGNLGAAPPLFSGSSGQPRTSILQPSQVSLTAPSTAAASVRNKGFNPSNRAPMPTKSPK